MRRETYLDEDQLLDDAHPAVRDVVLELAERAVAAGADPSRLEYVGAGMEGVTFRDGKRAFKVSRGERSLRNEADALSALRDADHPNVPRFYAYYPDLEVIVRQHIDGHPGGWGHQRQLHDVYLDISEVLHHADFSAPEYKEDSFVIDDRGHAYMVDLGFAYPIGKRGVATVREQVTDPSSDPFMTFIDIAALTRDGALRYDEGRVLLDELRRTFGPGEVDGHIREYELNYGGRSTTPNVGRFIGTCDRVRRSGNDALWHKMIAQARKITPQQFLSNVDLSDALDDGETAEEWLGDIMRSEPNATTYESTWGDRRCWFIESAGFEFIFAEVDR